MTKRSRKFSASSDDVTRTTILICLFSSMALMTSMAPAASAEPSADGNRAKALSACMKTGASLKECKNLKMAGVQPDPTPPAARPAGEPPLPAKAPDIKPVATASPDPSDDPRIPTTSSSSSANTAQKALGGAGAAAAANGAITFSEFPSGTFISTQYQNRRLHFGGDSPFITDDGANPTSPVLSGSPRFHGDLEIRVVNPRTGSPEVTKNMEFDVGFIDSPNSIEITYYNRRGVRIGSARTGGRGINHIQISRPVGIHRVTIRTASNEPAGMAIDNVKVGPSDPDSCKALAFVGVRGSGETALDGAGYGKFVNKIRNTFRSNIHGRYGIQEVFLDYTAAPIDIGVVFAPGGAENYLDSVGNGVHNLTQTLETLHQRCPNQLFVLAGYSQGAMVVHNTLAFGAGSLPVLNQVVAVELIADPMRIVGSPTNEGRGVGAGLAVTAGFPLIEVPDEVIAATRSYCIQSDPVCDTPKALRGFRLGGGPFTAIHNIQHGRKLYSIHTKEYMEESERAGIHAASISLKALRPK